MDSLLYPHLQLGTLGDLSDVTVARYGSPGDGSGGSNGGGPPPGKGPGGGGEETSGNNLSFPVILAGGITVEPVTPQFTELYTGPYTGLTPEQLAIAQGDDWYAQKEENNKWQADFKTLTASEIAVPEYIDWGDNAESVNPKLGRPFRLEVTLYDDVSAAPMAGYEMAVLAFPSSSKEVQGTSGETYDSDWATVAAAGDTGPKLVVQHIEGASDLTWDAEQGLWTGANVDAPETGFGFGPELNVGGKYIFGASQGGWVPDELGQYRITFYLPESSQIDFGVDPITGGATQVGNFADFSSGGSITEADEGGVAQAFVLPDLDLTYIDVTVVAGGGGSGGKGRPQAADLISLGASENGASNKSPFAGEEPILAGGQGDLLRVQAQRDQLVIQEQLQLCI
jgi:hypothetical protein